MMVDPRWPTPDFDPADEPEFVFHLTFRNSGSTAISRLLTSSPAALAINPRGEGQWLVPGLCEDDRWDPAKPVNYASVRATWISEYQRLKTPQSRYVVEKSPPNLMRIAQLSAVFRVASIFAVIRNPYANIASSGYRYHDFATLGSAERLRCIDELAALWINANTALSGCIATMQLPWATYEDFCAAPQQTVERLNIPAPIASSLNYNVRMNVKGSNRVGLDDFNATQIALLTPDEVHAATRRLAEAEPLLAFFGYQLMP